MLGSLAPSFPSFTQSIKLHEAPENREGPFFRTTHPQPLRGEGSPPLPLLFPLVYKRNEEMPRLGFK